MTAPMMSTVAVVGAGVIGRSWALVFARAACNVRVYDFVPEQAKRARAWFEAELDRNRVGGVLTAAQTAAYRERVRWCGTLEDALANAEYVQESGPESFELKESIFAELDQAAGSEAILASSTSAHDIAEITAGLAAARRCIVAHPVNPPHVIPVVEVLPGRETTNEVVERTCAFLAEVGQTPVRLKRYVPGFLLNRMQAALVREAVNLVDSGVADVDAVDAVIRDGLGLRWALLGPFGVAHTNADGGIRSYFARYGEAYRDLMDDLGPTPTFDAALVEHLGRGTEAMLRGVSHAELLRWRDRLVIGIRELKRANPLPVRDGADPGPGAKPD
jgi:3-hydroxyacyl-CoA dehydrogenase